MKKWIGAAMAAGACLVSQTALMGAAHADDTKLELSANVGLTSNYVFRGVTQTADNPAIQGGFDATLGSFYAGVWGSNLDFQDAGGISAPIEIDIYGGWTHEFGPVSADIGLVGYLYPGAKDTASGSANLDYMEVYLKGGYTIPNTNLGLGVNFFYSPEFTGGTGDAYYIEGTASYALTEALSVSGAFGYQDIENALFDLGDPTPESHYTNWNIGATYSAWGFTFDARYIDTDLNTPVGVGADDAKARGVFTVKRAF